MADSVQLTDLDVITRYSIAVRSATADRDELIQTLRSDLAWLERSGRSRFSSRTDDYDEVDAEEAPAPRKTAARRTSTSRTTARKTATKRTTARRTPR